MRGRVLAAFCAAASTYAVVGPMPASGQAMPLGYVTARGSTVTPAYEGWYPNPDGTITLSWGFYNRNSEEDLEIPFGPDNFMQPAELDGVQPTFLPAGREWGAFGVVVPADYEGEPVRWTLRIRGGTFTVPANLTAEWKIDARLGDANGNLPPELSFAEGGPWFIGPGGATAKARAAVGEPVSLTVWSRDDGRGAGLFGAGSDRVVPVALTWFAHSGPGDVVFGHDDEPRSIPAAGGTMTTTATFDEPGEYVIRVRANDGSGVSSAGHAQCCWTNAFFQVAVGAR
jgi:hypothetical protein